MAKLPEPRLKHVDDQTGLTVLQYDKMAPGRNFCDVVVVKACFDLTSDGIDPIPKPGQLSLADTHRKQDSPLTSSLEQAGDIILGKPGADIYVTGTARRVHATPRWRTMVSIGPVDQPVAHYECMATGPRQWQFGLIKGWHMSEPEFTEAVPVQYELAWGGCKRDADKPVEQWSRHKDNPSGSGYSFAGYSNFDTPAAPQWEADSILFGALKQQQFIGLGPVARFWASRKKYAGTYDQAWRRQFKESLEQKIAPDFATDIDLRFFQCAHPDLQTRAPLRGDEELRLDGLFPQKDCWAQRLPRLAVVAEFASRRGRIPLDTVHVDLDARQLNLVWHMALPQSRNVERVALSLGRL